MILADLGPLLFSPPCGINGPILAGLMWIGLAIEQVLKDGFNVPVIKWDGLSILVGLRENNG